VIAGAVLAGSGLEESLQKQRVVGIALFLKSAPNVRERHSRECIGCSDDLSSEQCVDYAGMGAGGNSTISSQ